MFNGIFFAFPVLASIAIPVLCLPIHFLPSIIQLLFLPSFSSHLFSPLSPKILHSTSSFSFYPHPPHRRGHSIPNFAQPTHPHRPRLLQHQPPHDPPNNRPLAARQPTRQPDPRTRRKRIHRSLFRPIGFFMEKLQGTRSTGLRDRRTCWYVGRGD
jgi:hypothetical protein